MSQRKHPETEWKQQQAIKLRIEENMTYQEIADTMGISKEYVSQLLNGIAKRNNFHRWAWDSSPFPALTRWMNENQMTKMDLATALGYSVSSNSQYIVYKRLREGRLSIDDVDKLLKITGMTYEELFRRGL